MLRFIADHSTSPQCNQFIIDHSSFLSVTVFFAIFTFMN